MYLSAGVDINSYDYDKRTPLHIAASEGQLVVASLMMSSGASVNARDRWGNSPLTDAIRVGCLEVAKKLIAEGASLKVDPLLYPDVHNETDASSWLCDLAREGDGLRLGLLLEGRIDPNAADYDARTCLHLAASEGQLPVVKALLERDDIKVNGQDRWGGTALADAVRGGHTQVAMLLREKGGELKLSEADASGQLCDLARHGDTMKLKLLLDCGCTASATDYDGRTALHLAASEGHKLVADALIDHGANVNSLDRWGNTPMCDAVREGHADLAKLLREKEGILAYTEARASSEMCDLAMQGKLESLRLLLDCGAPTMSADYDKRTALHIAAAEGHKHIVEEFLTRKDVVAGFKDRWDGTPLEDAKRHGHDHVVKILERAG